MNSSWVAQQYSPQCIAARGNALHATHHRVNKHTFDGSNHSSISSPLLGVCQMCDSIQVGCNEQAAGILSYTQAGVLDLVVIDVLVKPHNHCANLRGR